MRGALGNERGKLGIRELLEPALEGRMLGEHRLQLLAVANLDYAPAAAAKNLVEPLEHAVSAGRVEALAFVVDDPPQVLNVVLRALDDRFVDIAFVELGVADEGDEAAAGPLARPAPGRKLIHAEAAGAVERDA